MDESFKDFFDKAHDLIHFISPEGIILYVNQSWNKILGYTIEEIEGTCIYDYVLKDDVDEFKSYRNSILDGDDIDVETIFRVKNKSGNIVVLEGFVSVRMQDNIPSYTRGIFRDITAKIDNEKHLIEREKYMERLLSHAPDAVVVINQEGIVTFWNPKAEELFGWSSDEILGKELSSFIIPFNYRDAHTQGMKRYLATGFSNVLNTTIEITALKKTGE